MVNNKINIQIGSKAVGLLFGFVQVKEFAMAMVNNLHLYFDGDFLSPFGISKLIQTAHKNDCLIKEVPMAVSLEQISSWVDSGAKDKKVMETITNIVSVWQESEYTKSWVDNVKKNLSEIKMQSRKPKATSKKNLKATKSRSGAKASRRSK